MKGVHSKECIQLIKEKCGIVLRGNCDRHFEETGITKNDI